jgi:hypothetical protein
MYGVVVFLVLMLLFCAGFVGLVLIRLWIIGWFIRFGGRQWQAGKDQYRYGGRLQRRQSACTRQLAPPTYHQSAGPTFQENWRRGSPRDLKLHA